MQFQRNWSRQRLQSLFFLSEKGLFVIEPSGEDVKVTKPETEVRIW